MRFKIDLASLIVGRKFTVFALFYFVFEGNFPSTSPRGLIFGGAYTWRGLFSEFYGISEEHPVGRLQETSISEAFRHLRKPTLV